MKRLLIIVLLTLVLLPLPFIKNNQTNALTGLFNMSYIFFGDPISYVKQVDKTKGSLHVVSPNYFDVTPEGNLDVTWKLKTSFINEMHNRGIKVVPFLANHWNASAGINGLNNRQQLAKDIAAAIEKYNLDGVNVDIEGVNHNYRDAHTDFIRLLRSYIPAHKEVSVAVAANPNNWKTGWHGFYDYKALSDHATYLMIMAYDESWESPDSPVGPVSSIQFFEQSIQYAINQGVPKSKIVAGLPFYGRMWKLDGPTEEGVGIYGKGLSSTHVQPLVDRFNGSINFDANTQSSYAKFTVPAGQSAFVGSTKLTQGNYIIWFENENSITAKLRLPKQYGIKGTGSWALYHETPDTWDYYTAALNWGEPEKAVTQQGFGTGQMAITKTSVNMRNSASLAGQVIRSLSMSTPLKITGQSVTADGYEWIPVQTLNGSKGYVASSYINKFRLQELYGDNRYQTSVLVSSEGWEETSNVVVLGRGDIPIDALTGSVLAIKHKAPLLLTRSTKIPEEVRTELERLGPNTVYILGGESAISASVESELKKAGYSVKRIAGNTRYETSTKVASEVGTSSEIIVTTGKDSPDALAIAPYAGLKQFPIILTKKDYIPEEVATFINGKNISKATIIGGEAAVSKSVENQLKNLGIPNIERVSGQNRYETSTKIATRYKSVLNLSSLYFASGKSYIDALPGSPLAALGKSPIILVNNTTTLDPSVQTFLTTELTTTPDIHIIGGYSVLTERTRLNILQQLK
ncbi:cell wall-binding repeat-containing protein [Bacillus sp. JJ1533]|uniref:cell wall-binding repeat-containing protein n=1 Tax=Bacillus sp. JJ1533 TaxID=3122959 RepID=UPI002FFF533D